MLKKNYKYLLTFIPLCSCGDAPGTVNKKFLEEKDKVYLATKKHFLDLFSPRELRTVEIPGYYNYLIKFYQKCNDPEFMNLLADPEVAESILAGFVFLYQLNELTGSNFEITGDDKEKKINFIRERLIDCELILEQRVKVLNLQIDPVTIKEILERKTKELEALQSSDPKQTAEIDRLKNEIKDLEKKLNDLQNEQSQGKELSQNLKKLLEEKDRLCALLSHIDYILDKKNGEAELPQKKSLHDFRVYLENLFIQKNEAKEVQFLTLSGSTTAKKIVSLLEIFRDRKKIYADLKIKISEYDFNEVLQKILFFIASDFIINDACILKENDRAQSHSTNPTFLMECLLALLPCNSKTGNERFKEFGINADEKNFFLNIIFILLVSTSDSQYGNFNPNPFKYLRFDSVDIEQAFEIRALLRFAIDNIKRENEKKFTQTTELLSLLFNGPDYYYPDKQQKDISALIEWKKNNRGNADFVAKIEGFFDNNTLDKNFIRQVYLNLENKSIVAFGDTRANKAHTFVRNEEVWDARVLNNFSREKVPASAFYSLPVIVDNEISVALGYNESWKNESGESFSNTFFNNIKMEDTLLVQTIIFIDEALQKGVSRKRCQEFKTFIKSVFDECLSDYKNFAKFYEVLNFRFAQHGIDFPSLDDHGPRIKILEENVEALIQVRNENRNDATLYAGTFMELILNVCLLEALTKLVFPPAP